MMENMKRLLEYRKSTTGELVSFHTKSYFVTDEGQVWNDDLKRYLKQHEDNTGYQMVNLRDDEGSQHGNIGVHRLVVSTFIRLLENGESCHHKNHVKSDNRLENLEIISFSEHTRIHNYERWASGTYDAVAANASERAKKAWAAGANDGHGEKVKKAWAAGAYDGAGEKIAAKLRNVGTSRPAKPVAQLSLDGKLIRVWPSTSEAGRNGFDNQNISACCLGKLKKHHGFRWMYLSDYQKQQKEEAQQLELSFSE